MKGRPAGLLMSVLLLASACGETQSEVAAERQIVSVGVVGALSAEPGASVLRGVQMAITDYNSNTESTFEARVLRVPVDGSPASAGQGAERLISAERIIGVISALSSQDSIAVGSLLDGQSIPFIVPNLQAMDIASAARTTFRRLIANDRQEGAQLLAEGASRSQTPAFLVHTPDPEGTAFVEGAKGHLEKINRPISKVEAINPKADMAALSAGIIQSGVQLVGFGGDGQVGRNLALALKKAGFRGSALFSRQIMSVKGSASDLPDTFLVSSPSPDKNDPAISTFREAHRRRFSSEPGLFAIEAYEGALMLLEAIQEVEARPKEITEFLRLNRSFLGDSKEYNFDESGELLAPPIWLYQASGAWRYLGRSDRAKRTNS